MTQLEGSLAQTLKFLSNRFFQCNSSSCADKSHSNSSWRVLSCGHSFHEACFASCQGLGEKKISCPVCQFQPKKCFEISSKGFEALKAAVNGKTTLAEVNAAIDGVDGVDKELKGWMKKEIRNVMQAEDDLDDIESCSGLAAITTMVSVYLLVVVVIVGGNWVLS